MTYDQEEFNSYFHLFELGSYTPESHCPLWPLYKSPEATKLLRDKAVTLGGKISFSHFIVSFNLLRNSGEITQLRQPAPAEKEFTLSAEEYKRLPASQVVRRYRQDREFKQAVDALVAAGEI
jgi:hypothetical protein